MNNAIENEDGSHPFCDVWDGGSHTMLCQSLSPEYVKRNYKNFEKKITYKGKVCLNNGRWHLSPWQEKVNFPKGKITTEKKVCLTFGGVSLKLKYIFYGQVVTYL